MRGFVTGALTGLGVIALAGAGIAAAHTRSPQPAPATTTTVAGELSENLPSRPGGNQGPDTTTTETDSPDPGTSAPSTTSAPQERPDVEDSTPPPPPPPPPSNHGGSDDHADDSDQSDDRHDEDRVGGDERRPPLPMGDVLLAETVKILAMTREGIGAAVHDGATLAQLADAHGVGARNLISRLLAKVDERLSAQVSSGQITSKDAAKRRHHMEEVVTHFVNETEPSPLFGPRPPDSGDDREDRTDD